MVKSQRNNKTANSVRVSKKLTGSGGLGHYSLVDALLRRSNAGEQIVGIALSNAHSQPLLDILQVCTAHEGLGEASVVIVVAEKLG